MLARLFLLILLVFPVFAAESETEAVLRQKLAASEAARLLAIKDKVILQEALAKRLEDDKVALEKERLRASNERREVASNAAVDANRATEIATQTAVSAAAAAAAAQSQNISLIIVQFFGFAGVLVGMMYKGWTETRSRRWEQEDRQRQLEEAQAKHDAVITKLDVVEKQATAAYVEANTVNLKIASVGMEMKDKSKAD